jgi:trehalose/maltose hydrolase-like predicted phosphorylase
MDLAAAASSVALRSRRLVCFENKHLFAIEFEVTPLNFSGRCGWCPSSTAP